MQCVAVNRAMNRVADTTDMSGRATAESIKDGLRVKRQSSRWCIGEFTIFGSLVSFGVLVDLPLLAVGLQLFYGLQSYAQQVDLDTAAAAKAAAGREALTHPPAKVSGPVGTFITFDVPGAVNGTFPTSINPAGAITGYSLDVNSVGHGFLRDRNGTFITFDAPAAVNGTNPASINSAGAVTGYSFDANVVVHGFLRAKNGTITTFDAPGAGTGFFQGTFPTSINPAGAITGYSLDVNSVGHGFLRAKNGTITTFDAPGAGTTGSFPGTYAVGINPEGTIAGMYTDANNGSHGFLRASDGTFTTFDPPGRIAIFAPFSFGQNLYINPDGAITGTYFESISGNPFGGNFRVFVRTPDGTITTFDAATYPPCCIWSFPSGITPAGAITGSFNDGFIINHGFLRANDGTVTTFDVPGAGASANQGTAPLGINPAGVITGLYIDANRVSHGFLLLPQP